MFKIGEFSKLTQVSIRMLRHYDEVGLLKPATIDPYTNYRLYSIEQIFTINKIIFLRDLGFSITEISNALNNWSDSYITSLLEEKQQEIKQTIQAQKDKIAKIQLARRDINKDQIKLHYNVSIKTIPSYHVLSLRRVVPDYYSEGELWKEMSQFVNKNHISIDHSTFTIYHDPDYKETNVDIEICAPCTQVGIDKDGFTYRQTESIPLMASTMVYGHFKNIAGAYKAFANWLHNHNQYKMGNHSRQIVHRGPWNEENIDNYLTEIQIPLKKRFAK